MNVVGGLLSWIVLLICFPTLLISGIVLVLMIPLALVSAVVWALTGLGFLFVKLAKRSTRQQADL